MSTPNTQAIFIKEANCIPVHLSAANTASDGTGTLADLFTAGSNNSRIEGVEFRNCQATPAASSAMLGKIFLTDASGNNPELIGEVPIPAVTRSATVIGAVGTYIFSPARFLKQGQKIKVCKSVHAGVQDLVSVVPIGSGDY